MMMQTFSTLQTPLLPLTSPQPIPHILQLIRIHNPRPTLPHCLPQHPPHPSRLMQYPPPSSLNPHLPRDRRRQLQITAKRVETPSPRSGTESEIGLQWEFGGSDRGDGWIPVDSRFRSVLACRKGIRVIQLQ